MGQTCSSNLCAQSRLRHCNTITEEQRKELFTDFWENLSWEEKKEYIVAMVERVEVNRRRSRTGFKSRRNVTLKYHFVLDGEKIQVCQKMFCHTLDVSKNFIKYWLHHLLGKRHRNVESDNDLESEFYDEIEIHDYESMDHNLEDEVKVECGFHNQSPANHDVDDVGDILLDWE
uniref:Uncharacterized protein n=1 Tax=Graphocephala atropunctata TaxID=36148 RepID=A0A1B6MHZ9_9HEMI